MISPAVRPGAPIRFATLQRLAFTFLLVGGCSTAATSPPAPPASTGHDAGARSAGEASSDAAGPYKVGADVLEPVLLNRVPPQYPEEARKSGIRGRVVFNAVISEYGKVESLDLIDSDHPLLTKAAEDSIRQWRYRPATKEGQPVRVFLTVTTTFNMR